MQFKYLLSLMVLIAFSYLGSSVLFNSIPLPNIHHTGDLFMDFWNIAYQAVLGDPYTNGFFYHPLQFLIFGKLRFYTL